MAAEQRNDEIGRRQPLLIGVSLVLNHRRERQGATRTASNGASNVYYTTLARLFQPGRQRKMRTSVDCSDLAPGPPRAFG